MKFIVGLGNPGDKYRHTRHNVGFMVVDRLGGDGEWLAGKGGELKYLWLRKNDENGKKGVELIKPQTFMNKSGITLAYVRKKHPQLAGEDLFIVHDDLDLPVGKFKFHFGKGPKQHNGLSSIYQYFGTDQFWHLRIGIDGRGGLRTIPGDEYVLSSFQPTERAVVDKVITQVIQELVERLD